MPLPKPFQRLSVQGMGRSQLPLRGSPGFAPDSLLGLADGPGTATEHKILCFYDNVKPVWLYIQYPLPISFFRGPQKPMSVLQSFHPAVAAWFSRTFAAPTEAQEVAWPALREGRHV